MKTTLGAPLNEAEIALIKAAREQLFGSALNLRGELDPVMLQRIALEMRALSWDLAKAVADAFATANQRAYPPPPAPRRHVDQDYLKLLGIEE